MSTKHTPTPWKYTVNVGPTKGAVVTEDGYSVFDVINRVRSGDRFAFDVRHAVHCVNAHDGLVARVTELEAALQRAVDVITEARKIACARTIDEALNDPLTLHLQTCGGAEYAARAALKVTP